MVLRIPDYYRSTPNIQSTGLSTKVFQQALGFVYNALDEMDAALLAKTSFRLAEMVELANLSSMFGNLLRTGIANASKGLYHNNGPHKHPDLLHSSDASLNMEIKVALEDNQPKGHLAKPGWHLTCHYVLCAPDGSFKLGIENRGCIPRVWLLRFGFLRTSHFNISNTAGDSGKTAVVNAEGIKCLHPIYFVPSLCAFPISKRSKKSKTLFEAFQLPYAPGE